MAISTAKLIASRILQAVLTTIEPGTVECPDCGGGLESGFKMGGDLLCGICYNAWIYPATHRARNSQRKANNLLLAMSAQKFGLEFLLGLDIPQADDELLGEISSYYSEKPKEYMTTPEYRELYPLLVAINKEHRRRFKETGEQAMAKIGLAYGDRVFYDHVRGLGAERYEGIIVRHKTRPKVKLTKGETMQGKRTVNWHKGWKPLD